MIFYNSPFLLLKTTLEYEFFVIKILVHIILIVPATILKNIFESFVVLITKLLAKKLYNRFEFKRPL